MKTMTEIERLLNKKVVLRWEENDQMLHRLKKHELHNITMEKARYLVQYFLIPMAGVQIIYFIEDTLGNVLFFEKVK